MTRYACKSYHDDDAQEKRWAVERMDGNIKRVLQRSFITQEGAQVWLDRYVNIKQNKHIHQGIRDQQRRYQAKNDPRRATTTAGVRGVPGGVPGGVPVAIQNHTHRRRTETATSLPPPIVTSGDIITACITNSGAMCLQLSQDCVHAVPSALGFKSKGPWSHHHCFTCKNWFTNPVALDVCMSWWCCAPCLIHNMHTIITEEKIHNHQSRDDACHTCLNPGLCCLCRCACNRRRIVRHYNMQSTETCAQTWCFSCCCCCCAQCQEMNEVAVRGEGHLRQPCNCLCCPATCLVGAGKSQAHRYTNRNSIGSRIGRRSRGGGRLGGGSASALVVATAPPAVYAERVPETSVYVGNVVSTADRSVQFQSKLDLGNDTKKKPMKTGWTLDLAPRRLREGVE